MYCAVFYPVLPTIPNGVTDCLDAFIGALDQKSSVEAFDRLQVPAYLTLSCAEYCCLASCKICQVIAVRAHSGYLATKLQSLDLIYES